MATTRIPDFADVVESHWQDTYLARILYARSIPAWTELDRAPVQGGRRVEYDREGRAYRRYGGAVFFGTQAVADATETNRPLHWVATQTSGVVFYTRLASMDRGTK